MKTMFWIILSMALVALLALFVVRNGHQSDVSSALSFTQSWFWVRLVIYLTVFLSWPYLTKYLIRYASKNELKTSIDRDQQLAIILQKKRLKVLFLFMIIEVVAFQQFGLIYGS